MIDRDDREIYLLYFCAECDKRCPVYSEQKLFAIVESTVCGETQKLHCDECVAK